MPLDYEIPELALEHLIASVAGLKKKTGLEFHIIARQSPKQAPWIVIDKASKAQAKVAKALRVARKDPSYMVARTASGEVEVIGRTPHFMVVQSNIASLPKRLQTEWPMQLRKHGDAALKKLGVALKNSVILATEEEVAGFRKKLEAGTAEEPVRTIDPLDAKELEAIFDEDVEDVKSGSAQLTTLNGKLKAGDEAESTKAAKELVNTILTDALGADEAKDVLNDLDAQVGGLIKLALLDVSSSGTPLEVGKPLPQAVQLMSLASEYAEMLRAASLWESLLDQVEQYDEDLAVIEKTHGVALDPEAEDFDEQSAKRDEAIADYESLLDRRNKAYARSVASGREATSLAKHLESEIAALQKTTKKQD